MVECGVCNKIIASPTGINLICDHHFHIECLNKKKICPVCHVPRQNSSKEQEVMVVVAVNHNFIRISDGLVGSSHYDPGSGYYIYPPDYIFRIS